MQFLKTPWKNYFLDLVAEAKNTIRITSPFVKENICDEILNVKANDVEIDLITSFKLMNIYSGSLDLSGLEKILSNKGNIRNFSKLHSKIYLFDDSKAIVTSANLTNGGLLNNYEYGILLDSKNEVNEIINDYNSLFFNNRAGIIKQENIDIVRKIIANLPPRKDMKFPHINLDSPENKLDIITIPKSSILSSLKGWKLEVFKCINQISHNVFYLNEINEYENYFKKLYPDNNHILDKIRQQLQYLRDFGLIEFLGNGKYKKLWIMEDEK